MAAVSCPSCRRALDLPDDLRGQSVQCPACATTFAIGAPESPRVAHAVTPTPPPAPITADGTGFPTPAFGHLEANDLHGWARRKARSAANRMSAAVILFAVTTPV